MSIVQSSVFVLSLFVQVTLGKMGDIALELDENCIKRLEEDIPSHIPLANDREEIHPSCSVPIVSTGSLKLRNADKDKRIADIVPPGSIIELTCEKGQSLVGGHYLSVCLKNGNWDTKLGTCLTDPNFGQAACVVPVTNNGKIFDISTGAFVKGGETIQMGNKVELVCNKNFVAGSLYQSECGIGAVWTVVIEDCIPAPKNCAEGPKLPHAVFVGDEIYTLNAERLIYCNPGYILSGIGIARCEQVGSIAKWLYYGTCDKRCQPLPTIPNGKVILSSDPYLGIEGRIECHDNYGFTLTGGGYVKCDEVDGTWSASAGRCMYQAPCSSTETNACSKTLL